MTIKCQNGDYRLIHKKGEYHIQQRWFWNIYTTMNDYNCMTDAMVYAIFDDYDVAKEQYKKVVKENTKTFFRFGDI